MKPDAVMVWVTVKNEGLSVSAPNKLQIWRSRPNDAVHDQLLGNENTRIGADTDIPQLAPGESRLLEVPWRNQAGPGVYGLRVKLASDDADANPRNNNLLVHRRLE